MFEGVFTAIVTPFTNGKIDYDSVEKVIEHQIAGGVDGIVPMGTTGESPTVSYEEHEEFITRVVKIVNKRIKVIAGTGSNSTDEAVYLSKAAQDAGVDAVMLVNPYYNRPPQRGMITHFENIAKSIHIPVVIYNIPGRTGVNFLPESVAELIKRVPNIVAIKEASGDIVQMMNVVELCGDKITLLSGDDNMLLPILGIGGKGIISVLANLLPADVKAVVEQFHAGNHEGAKARFYRLLPLCRAIFYETNPIPIKAAMEMAGFCTSEVRLPLVPISPDNREKLKKALAAYGVKV